MKNNAYIMWRVAYLCSLDAHAAHDIVTFLADCKFPTQYDRLSKQQLGFFLLHTVSNSCFIKWKWGFLSVDFLC